VPSVRRREPPLFRKYVRRTVTKEEAKGETSTISDFSGKKASSIALGVGKEKGEKTMDVGSGSSHPPKKEEGGPSGSKRGRKRKGGEVDY